MAISRVKMRNVYMQHKLRPGNFYTRPVVPVFYRGLQGYGQSSQLSRETFEKYLKQKAVSPFAVNSQAYMQEIRDHYGYDDNGTYEVLGTVGGVVGAGVGAMFSSGLLNLPFQFPLTSPKFWKASSWQSPLDFKKIINKDWSILTSNKRYARHRALFGAPEDVSKTTDTALTLGKHADKAVDAADVVNTAKKAGSVFSKKASGFLPWVGTAADVASLGFSSALVEQVYKSETASVGLKIAATAELIGDALSVAGDALEMFTVTAPAGVILSIIGGIVSIAAGAFTGGMIGQTVGHSLSAEGAKAQEMFLSNLYAGMMQRPISSVGTILTMFTPAMISSVFSRLPMPKNFFKHILKPLQVAGEFLSGNAIGIQARAGLTMLAVQGMNKLTAPLDEMLPWAPSNPEDVSLVSAISFMGDLNDNLYGATLRKSTLLGLLKNDPDAMVEAFARSWGTSDKPYYSVNFDDVREAANINLGNFGNSLFSIAGELLIDPQNFTEVVGRISEVRAADALSEYVVKDIKQKQAAVSLKRGIGAEGTIEEVVGKAGILNPEFIPPTQRKQFFKRLTESYIKDPENGVRLTLTQFFTSRVHGYNIEGTNKALQVTAMPKKLAYQTELVNKYFKSITEGTYHSAYNFDEMKSVQQRIKRFLKIKADVEAGKEVKNSENALLHLGNTIKRLKEIYGNDTVTDEVLFDKFVKDLNIKINDNQVAKLAIINKDLQQHIELSDALGRGVNMVTNPMSALAKGGLFAATKFSEKIRNWYADRKNVARTIVDVNKLIGGTEVKVYNKKDLEQAYIQTGGLDRHGSLYTKFSEEQKSNKVQIIATDINNAIKTERTQALKNIDTIEKMSQEYQDKANESAELMKKGIYTLPMEYAFSKQSKIEISDTAGLERLEKDLDKYETEEGQRLSQEALEAKINNNRDSEDTQLYLQKRVAVAHYRSRVLNANIFGGVYTIQSNITGLLAHTLYKFQDELVGVLSMYSVLRDLSSTDPSKNKFDLEQWNELQKYFAEKSLDPDAFLLRYGIVPFVKVVEDGKTRKIFGVKSVLVAKEQGIDLQIELANIPLANIVTSIVHKALHLNDVESMRQGIIDLYKNISAEDLRKKMESLKDKPVERYQFIRQLILDSGNFTKEQYKEIFTVETLTKIYSAISTELERNDVSKYVQVNEVNIDELRALVFSKFYSKDNAELQVILNTFKDYDERIIKVSQVLEKQGKKNPDALNQKRVLNTLILDFNTRLHFNTAFKFMSAFIRPSVVHIKGDTDTRLFLAPDARKNLLPPKVTKEQLKEMKKIKMSYNEEAILLELDANKIQQELLNTSSRREQSERINATIFKSDKVYENDELIFLPTGADEAPTPATQSERARREQLKEQTYEEASNYVPFLKQPDLLNNLDVFQAEFNFELLDIPTVKQAEDPSYSLVRYALNAPEKFVKFSNGKITLTLQQTRFTTHSDAEFKDFITYDEVLKRNFGRSSPQHHALMVSFAEDLVALSEKNRGEFVIDAKQLLKPKRGASMSNREYFVEKIAYTYEKKGFIRITSTLYQPAQVRTSQLFKSAVHNVFQDYAKEYDLKLSDVKALYNAKKGENTELKAELIERIYKKYNRGLKGGNLSVGQRQVEYMAKELFDFEQRDVGGLSNKYITINPDFAKKAIFNSADVQKLFQDFIRLRNGTDADNLETELGRMLLAMNDYIQEAQSKKLNLSVRDITDFTILVDTYPHATIKFIVKDIKEPLTLAEMYDRYNLDLTTMNYIINHYTVIKADELSAEQIIQNQAIMRTEYFNLVNMYAETLRSDSIDIDEDMFKMLGGTPEELALIKDYELTYLYNTLLSNALLDTTVEGHTPSSVTIEKNNNLPLHINKNVIELLSSSYKLLQSKDTEIYGLDKQMYEINSIEKVFLLSLIQTPDISRDTKEFFLKRIFFRGVQVATSGLTTKDLDTRSQVIEVKQNELGLLSEQSDVYINKSQELQTLKQEYDQLKREYLNLDSRKLFPAGAPKGKHLDTFINHLLDDASLADALIYYTGRLSSDTPTVRAEGIDKDGRPTGVFYVVNYKDSDNELNVTPIHRGVPKRNNFIGENIIKYSDAENVSYFEKALVSNAALEGYGSKLKVTHASNVGVIFVVDEKDIPLFREGETMKLIKEQLSFNADQKRNLIFITQAQLNDIEEMLKTGVYDTLESFQVKLDPKTGEVLGKVPGILNTKASSQTGSAPAFFKDLLNRLVKRDKKNNIDVNESMSLIQRLVKFIEVKQKHKLVEKAYTIASPLNQTEMFESLYQQSRVHILYSKFVQALTANGLSQTNIGLLSSVFFNNLFLAKDNNGDFFDLSKIANEIDNPKFLYQLQTIRVTDENGNNVTMLQAIQNVLKKTQTEVASNELFADIEINTSSLLNNNFLNTVEQLSDKVYSVMTELKERNRTAYNTVLTSLKKKETFNLIEHITTKEVQDRNRFVSAQYKGALTVEQSKFDSSIQRPYFNTVFPNAKDTFVHGVETLKDYYNGLDPDTKEKNAFVIAYEATKIRQEYKESIAKINSERIKKDSEGKRSINWKLFKSERDGIVEALNEYESKVLKGGVPEKLEAATLKFPEITDNLTQDLQSISKIIINKYEDAKKSLTPTDEQKHIITLIESIPYDISTPNGFTKAVTAFIVTNFYNLISAYTAVYSFEDYTADSIMLTMQNQSAPEGKKLSKEALDKITDGFFKDYLDGLKNRPYKFKPEEYPFYYERVTKEDGRRVLSNTGIPLSLKTFQQFFEPFLTDKESKGVLEKVTDLYIAVEAHLFKSSPKTLKDITVKQTDMSIPRTVRSYLDSITDPAQREFLEFWIEAGGTRFYRALKTMDISKGIEKYKYEVDPSGRFLYSTKHQSIVNIEEGAIYEIMKLRRKQRQLSKGFPSVQDTYNLLRIPYLDHDETFKQSLNDNLFSKESTFAERRAVFGSLGIKSEGLISRLENAKTVSHMINILKSVSELNEEHMYALTYIINRLKKFYIEKHFDTIDPNGPNWSWKDVENEFITKPLSQAKKDLKILQDTHTFDSGDRFGNNILRQVKQESNIIFGALKFISDTNAVLRAYSAPDTKLPTTAPSLEENLVLVNESPLLKQSRLVSREILGSIFAPRDGSTSLKGVQLQELDRVLDAGDLEVFTERRAKSLKDAQRSSKTYNDLREIFTKLLKHIYTDVTTKTQEELDAIFVRIFDIGVSFQTFKENPDSVPMYEDIYDNYITQVLTDEVSRNKHEEALNAIIKHFEDGSGFLTKAGADIRFIKAVMALILEQRFTVNEKAKYFTEQMHDYLNKQVKAQEQNASEKLDRLSTRLSINHTENELEAVFFPDMEAAKLQPDFKESYDLFTYARDLRNFINNTAYSLDPNYLEDSIDTAYLDAYGPYYEESAYIVKLRNLTNKEETLKQDYETLLKQHRKILKELDIKEDTSEEDLDELATEFNNSSIQPSLSIDTIEAEIKKKERILNFAKKKWLMKLYNVVPAIGANYQNAVGTEAQVVKQKLNGIAQEIKEKLSFYEPEAIAAAMRQILLQQRRDLFFSSRNYRIYREALNTKNVFKNGPESLRTQLASIHISKQEALDTWLNAMTLTKKSFEELEAKLKEPASVTKDGQVIDIKKQAEQLKNNKVFNGYEKNIQQLLNATDNYRVLDVLLGLSKPAQQTVLSESQKLHAVTSFLTNILKGKKYSEALTKKTFKFQNADGTSTDTTLANIVRTLKKSDKTYKKANLFKIVMWLKIVTNMLPSNDAPDIQELKQQQEVLHKTINDNNQHLKDLEFVRRQYKDLKETKSAEIIAVQKQIEVAKQDLDTANSKANKERLYGISNIGTYKKLYGIKNTASNEEVFTDVLNRYAKSIKGGVEALTNKIKEYGNFELHNPIVDTLITRCVRLAQWQAEGKKAPSTFYTFDMETVKDEFGNNTPYMMTFLIDKKGKTEVVTYYINNPIFFAEEGSRYKVLLDNFYKQQRDIARKVDPTRTDEDINKETDTLVARIKNMPNLKEFVQTFIKLFTDAAERKIPILAHNGFRFDFHNYETFIAKTGQRLLSNLYYQLLSKNEPNEIRQRLKGTLKSELKDELQVSFEEKFVEELDKAFDHIMNNKSLVPEEDIRILKDIVKKRYAAKLNIYWKEAAIKQHILLDEEAEQAYTQATDNLLKSLNAFLLNTGTPEEQDTSKETFIKFFLDAAQRQGLLNMEEFEKQIRNALVAMKFDFDAIMNAEKQIDYQPIIKSIRQRVFEQLKQTTPDALKDAPVHFDQAGKIKALRVLMETIDDSIGVLKGTGNINDILNHYNIKIDRNKRRIEELTDTLENLKATRKVLTDTKQVTLESFQKVVEHIDRTLGNPVYQSTMIFNRELDYDERRNTNGFTDSMLTINIKQKRLIKEAYTTLQSLKQLMSYLSSKSLDEINQDIKQGKLNLSLFNFKTAAERASYVKELNNSIEALKKLLNEDGELTDSFNEAVNSYMQKMQQEIKDQLDLTIDRLKANWNDNKTPARQLSPDASQRYDAQYYNDFIAKLSKNYNTHESGLVDILSILKPNGAFFKMLHIYNTKDVKEASPALIELTTAAIKQDIELKTDLLERAKKSELLIETENDLKTNGLLETVSENFNSAFNKIVSSYQVRVKKEAINTFNTLDNKKNIIKSDITFEQAAPMAKKYYNNEQIKTMNIQTSNGSKREYYNLRQDFDKQGLYIKEDVLVGVENYGDTPDEDSYKIGYVNTPDDTFNHINIKKTNPGSPTLSFRYSYHTLDSFLLQKPKVIEEDVSIYEEVYDESTDSSYWQYRDPMEYIRTKIKNITKYVEVYKPDGKDKSMESIERMLALYRTHMPAFSEIRKLRKEYKENAKTSILTDIEDKLKGILKGVNWDNELDLRFFDSKNLNDEIVSKLKRHLDMLDTQNKTITPEELFELRTGLYQKYYAKYSSTSPDSYVMMIPTEFSNNYLLTYQDEDLDRLKISLEPSSENSSGASHRVKTFYEFPVPFRQGVNVSRTVLNYNKLLSMSTPDFLINAAYTEEDNYGTKNNFMDYFIDGNTGKLSQGFTGRNKIDEDDQALLNQLLIHKYNDKYVNAFTPHVLTQGMYDRYQADTLHKMGVNIPIVSTEDNRAHEDNILYDTNYASAQRFEEGSKIWIGEYYGYKGSQQHINDLFDTYGALALIRSSSVVNRSTRGMDIPLAISNIRSVLTGDIKYLPNDIKQFITEHLDYFRLYFKVNEAGKLIVDENIDYVLEVFNKIAIELKDDSIKTGEQLIEKLIFTTPLKKGYKYQAYDERTQTYKEFKVPQRVKFGTMYVMLDMAHTPADMNINAKVVSEYNISAVYKSYLDSVQDGVVISPSVIQTMRAKGNVDWDKAFPPHLNKTNLYAEVGQRGAEAILDLFRVVKGGAKPDAITLAAFIENHLKTPSLISKMINYLHYKQVLDTPNPNPTLKQFAEYQLQKINLSIKEMVKTLITKQGGALYQSFYYKHEGIRQQLLANTSFKTGTMALGRVGFHTMRKMKPNWLQSEQISEQELKEIKELLPYKDIDPKDLTSKQRIAQLEHYNRFGILTDTINGKSNFTFTDAVWAPNTKGVNPQLLSVGGYKLKQNPTRYYGYVLGIRSPVQDYNAVPMMKVVGYTPHHSVEANTYLYSMIGGDNDGDTLGIVALDMQQVDHLAPKVKGSELRLGLDATNPAYYDNDYIKRIMSKFKEEDAKSSPHYDMRYNYAGKNTFKRDEDEIATFQAAYHTLTGHELKEYLPRDHYSWWEFYHNTINSDKLDKALNKVSEKELDSVTLNEQETQFYLDVVLNNFDTTKMTPQEVSMIMRKISIFDQRTDTNTKDSFKLEDTLTEADVKRFTSKLSKEYQARLQDVDMKKILTSEEFIDVRKQLTFNKIYHEALKKTIMRFRVSKLGINFFGSIRKKIFEGIHILTMPNINADVDEKFFNHNVPNYKGFLNFEDVKNMLSDKVSKKTDLDSFETLDSLKDYYFKNAKLNTFKGDTTEVKVIVNELLELYFNNHQECVKLEKELTSFDSALTKLFKDGDATQLDAHFSNIDKFRLEYNPLLAQLIKDLLANPRKVLNDYEKAILNSAYFGKDLGRMYNLSSNIKHYAEQHAQQLILTRSQYRKLSNLATQIIAVAKHEGVNISAPIFLRNFARSLKRLYSSMNTKPRIVQMNQDDYIFSLGLLADSNVLENLRTPFYEEAQALRKSNKNVDKSLNITKARYESLDNYNDVGLVQTNLNNNIAKALNIELLNKPIVPPAIHADLQKIVAKVFEVFKNNRGVKNQMAALESTSIKGLAFYKDEEVKLVDALMQYDLSAYKLERYYERALSLYDTSNKRYINATHNQYLNTNGITALTEGAAFYRALEVMRNPGFKEELIKTRSQYTKSIRFFLSELTVDLNYLEADENGQVVRRYVNDKTFSDVQDQENYNKGLYSEMFDNPQTKVTKEQYNQQRLLADSYGSVLKNYGIGSTKSMQTLESLLNIIKENFESVKQALADNKELKSSYKDTQDDSAVARALRFASQDVYSVTKTITDQKKKAALNRQYISLSKQIEEIESQINNLRTEIEAKSILIRKLEESKAYEEEHGDSSKIISAMEQIKLKMMQDQQELVHQVAMYAFHSHFLDFTTLIKNADGRTRNEMLYQQEQRKATLNGDRVKTLANSAIIKLAELQTPFLNMLSFYEIYDKGSKQIIDYDWKQMFKDYKQDHDFLRLTVMMDPFKDETLVKKLYDFIYLDKTDWKALSKDQRKEFADFKKYFKKGFRFESFDQVIELMNKVNGNKAFPRLKLSGQPISTIDKESVAATNYLTPTLKEIDIKSGDDLRKVYEYIKANSTFNPKTKTLTGAISLIGFVNLNNLMTAMDLSYKPVRFGGGRAGRLIAQLSFVEKLMMRFNPAFLSRNFFDTWFQLFTERFTKEDLAMFVLNGKRGPKAMLDYMVMTNDIYDIYNALNDDRVITMREVDLNFIELQRLLASNTPKTEQTVKTVIDHLSHIHKVLTDYKESVDVADDKTKERLAHRSKRLDTLIPEMKSLIEYADSILKNKQDIPTKLADLGTKQSLERIKKSITFLLNMKFGEYFLVYDSIKPIKNQSKIINRHTAKYRKRGKEAYDDFKTTLFEISAFMNTNALLDEFQTKLYDDIRDFEQYDKLKRLDENKEYTYEEATKNIRKDFDSKLKTLVSYATLYKPYVQLNERIEITGRIAGFLYDRYMNNESFDRSTSMSLKRFFNYGQRSPLEKSMMANIPYLSFPLRSIRNWIERLNDPRFMVLMSDLLDGAYGQYQDENGQYSEFEKFMIENGWLPITDKIGLRFGNGAFDIQRLLSNPSSIMDRARPLLIGIASLINTGDLTTSMKSLASAGVITNIANFVTGWNPSLREDAQQHPVMKNFVSKKKASLGTTLNMFFDYSNGNDYKKYTPYRYRQPANGRYAYYENIYRDWFTKYGKMRKPTVDPYSLVKNIQWKQYVKMRQSKALLGKK